MRASTRHREAAIECKLAEARATLCDTDRDNPPALDSPETSDGQSLAASPSLVPSTATPTNPSGTARLGTKRRVRIVSGV